MKYTVIEMQNGAIGNNKWEFENLNQAEAKYHSVLSVAATSSVAVHTCVIISEEGFVSSVECYKHPAE